MIEREDRFGRSIAYYDEPSCEELEDAAKIIARIIRHADIKDASIRIESLAQRGEADYTAVDFSEDATAEEIAEASRQPHMDFITAIGSYKERTFSLSYNLEKQCFALSMHKTRKIDPWGFGKKFGLS